MCAFSRVQSTRGLVTQISIPMHRKFETFQLFTCFSLFLSFSFSNSMSWRECSLFQVAFSPSNSHVILKVLGSLPALEWNYWNFSTLELADIDLTVKILIKPVDFSMNFSEFTKGGNYADFTGEYVVFDIEDAKISNEKNTLAELAQLKIIAWILNLFFIIR